MARSRVDEARAVFTKIGVDGSGIDEELADIQRSLDLEHHEQGDSLFQAKYRKPIFLAVAIAMFNQLSGINALDLLCAQDLRYGVRAKARRRCNRLPSAERTCCSQSSP